jgi:hypothetical protein
MELIKEIFDGKVRIYQLDFKIKNIKGAASTIKELFENDPMELRVPWKLWEDISESINKIAISDAKDHIERLVFPAFDAKNMETGEIRTVSRPNMIHGRTTMMTTGGDPNSVYDDKVYVRALRMLQKRKEK